jgi:predicted phage tail protein
LITIVFVKNPFEPDKDRSIKQVECSGEVLESYIAEYRTLLPDQELHIQVDGTIVKHPDQWLVMDGAFITVHPVVGKGGKSILGLVAMVALSVVSFGVGGLASNVGWTAIGTTAGWTTAGYLAAAGMMLIGGTLLSRFMSPKVSLGKFNNSTEDPTYSWNGITTMDGQGNAVAITYGKVKSGGQSIAKFITNNNNDQVLNFFRHISLLDLYPGTRQSVYCSRGPGNLPMYDYSPQGQTCRRTLVLCTEKHNYFSCRYPTAAGPAKGSCCRVKTLPTVQMP